MNNNDIFSSCTLCPRECHADREHGKIGACGVGASLRVARAALHMWEEPIISGKNGSGTVFFSGCPLSCVFCQNRNISHKAFGKDISVSRLAEIFLELQKSGAHNINLVTPTHFVPKIIDALDISKSRGLSLPIVYNSSGYESVPTLRMLSGYVDIYLPDFKYMDPDIAGKYSACRNYPEKAKSALYEMVSQTGDAVLSEDGMIKRGTIVRHLVLPGNIIDSMKVIEYLYNTYKDKIYISIMKQYTPCKGLSERFPELSRKLTTYEYEKVTDFAARLGVKNGFIQYGDNAKESFIPDFDYTGV
ncbi:MAG: 4Fe-4S cluster-binding domain-containing protein [Eubacteriales bacterium]